MSALAHLLRYVPERDRLPALRAVLREMEAQGEHEAVAVCAGLIGDLEALRPREAVRAERQITEEDGA